MLSRSLKHGWPPGRFPSALRIAQLTLARLYWRTLLTARLPSIDSRVHALNYPRSSAISEHGCLHATLLGRGPPQHGTQPIFVLRLRSGFAGAAIPISAVYPNR